MTASRKTKRAPIGIGDDAAALFLSPSATLLATTDMLIEGVHFDLTTTDLFSLGWKAAAVNLSDIAAMGGVPRFCLTALGIPPSLMVEDITEFYRGVNACLMKFGTVLVGGDTCHAKKGFVISVTVLGEGEEARHHPLGSETGRPDLCDRDPRGLCGGAGIAENKGPGSRVQDSGVRGKAS